jgi:hypothetical protein
LRPAQLRREDLAAQRPADQVHGARGLDQPAALGAVDLQHGVNAAGRQVAQLSASGPVPLARAPDARGQVVPGQHGERHRVPAQHPVQPVVGRHDIEQPRHRRLLESFAARRVHAGGPAGRNILCHESSLP